jgi:hypothetical protein
MIKTTKVRQLVERFVEAFHRNGFFDHQKSVLFFRLLLFKANRPRASLKFKTPKEIWWYSLKKSVLHFKI